MGKRPVILISAGHDIDYKRHVEELGVHGTYTLAVIEGGGLPAIPLDDRCAEDYARNMDGLIITGGWALAVENLEGSVISAPYVFKYIKEKREPFELALYRAFRDAGKPIMGICYGHQVINVGQDGDLDYEATKTYKSEHRNGVNHMVSTEKGSLLNELFGDEFEVNSFHAFSVKTLGKDLKITARSMEGVPEAIEHNSLPIFGFQWHPERMRGETDTNPYGADMSKVFKHFMDLCTKRREEM